MKSKLIILMILFCTSSGQSKAQTTIIEDSVLFTWTFDQIDSFLTAEIGTDVSDLVGIRYGLTAHKVIYKTLNYDSTETQASGLLLLPHSDYCALPIVSYQHGTVVERFDVPSRFYGDEKLIAVIMASNGMIACMPDYHGMGDGPGIHPYQNARTEAFSVIDFIRAAKELATANDLSYGDQLFLVGYSQGGHATMAAHKYIQEYLGSEMQVTASAPMSGSYDMSGVQTDLLLEDEPYSDPYYLPMLIFGNNPIYNFYTNIDELLKEPYASALPPLMDGLHSSGQINAAMNDTVKKIFRDDVLNDFINDPNHFFHDFLEENDVYQWVPQAPMNIYYCTQDEKVPYQNSYVAYNYFTSNGATNIDTINVGDMMHLDCAQPALVGGKLWFDQFRDVPLEVTESHYLSDGSNNGQITLSIFGGKLPLQVEWNTGDNTLSIDNLPLGIYTYTVTDGNGCEIVGSVDLSTVSIIDLAQFNIRLYPNPANDLITIESDALLNEVLYIQNIVGQTVKTIQLSNKIQSLDISDLNSGIYFCKIGDRFIQSIIKK